MEVQLQLCRDLFQAVLSSKEGCNVPASFNSSLLDALQRLMMELQQQHYEEQTKAVRRCLEAVLQLLSRISCLGSIEAFFTADDLLQHYQHHVDKANKLTSQLQERRQQRGTATATLQCAQAAATSAAPCVTGTCSSSSIQLQVPAQQLRILASFRQQAADLCPRLLGTCTAEQLQQLCNTVKEGLVLVNGHRFLLDQDWQAEVSAMMARAEQLKILLAHRQAHHISLLAAVLQHLHRAEVQEFDRPPQQQLLQTAGYTAKRLNSLSSQLNSGLSSTAATGSHGVLKAVRTGSVGQQQQQQQASIVVAAGFEAAADVLKHIEDEFYMPVAPLPVLTGSACSTPRSSALLSAPGLPFDLCSHSIDASDDSLARLPSSGCSSLLEYVHSIPATDTAAGSLCSSIHGLGLHSGHSSSGQQSALRRITEEQLQGIAGPEIASVLAAALGVTLDCTDRDRVEGGGSLESSSSSGRKQGLWSSCDWDRKAAAAVPRPGLALASLACGSSSSSAGRTGDSRLMSAEVRPIDRPDWGLEVAGRQSSEPLISRLFSSTRSSSPMQPQQQQRHRRLWSGGSRSSSPAIADETRSNQQVQHPWSGGNSSSKKCPQCELRLQHMPLPPGCCKSIGAVLYISPHLARLVLSDVGLDDEAVFDLVDALKVNSSIVVLDLSRNRVEDIGARALAGLLRQRAGSSSKLRALYLQENLIGDDGAIALAGGLTHNSSLQRLWLQYNAMGESGALALATTMQHNTSCTSLKLLPQSTEAMLMPLGQMAQKLAKHNRSVREHIKGLLTRLLPDTSAIGS